MPRMTYVMAINQALHQMMEADGSVFLMGQGVKSPWYVGNSADGLLDRFGADRVIDTPVSENAVTGAGVGAALVGMRPIVVHPRMDFMFYALDPIINQAANWYYMNGGKLNVPLVVWGIINRGGEQAAQHSQSLHALFAHAPGLKVVMPSVPHDAKGLMIAAIKDENPVVFIDDRWLHSIEGEVPAEVYEVPLGQAAVVRKGADVTIVTVSYMTHLALEAAEELAGDQIQVEVLDLRTVKPLDREAILASVQKTGRLVVGDVGWKTYGVSAEVAALLAEEGCSGLKVPVRRVALPDLPAPASAPLERAYYPTCQDVAAAVRQVLDCKA